MMVKDRKKIKKAAKAIQAIAEQAAGIRKRQGWMFHATKELMRLRYGTDRAGR